MRNPYWVAVILIALISFALMWSVATQETLTFDEKAHIPAGYGYVRYLDYRLNPEHPPIVKVLSAIPLLFLDLRFPIDSAAWRTELNAQWDVGEQFLYFSGNNADDITKWARLGPILLTLTLILFTYAWASELLGRRWALLPTLLFAFSPTVLAHGHYVTTDIGAALGIFGATYYFLKALGKPSRNNLIIAGVAMGIAQLMKFSAVLLVPLFIGVAGVWAILRLRHEWHLVSIFGKLQKIAAHVAQSLRILGTVLLIGIVMIYLVYAIFMWNYPMEKQVADTRTILHGFGGGPTPPGETCAPKRCIAELDMWMAGQPLLRPLGHYLFGILMVAQRTAGGNAAYFLGELSGKGWWYYFPTLYVLKEPIPALMLAAIGVLYLLLRVVLPILRQKKRLLEFLELNFAEFTMFLFVMGYWVYSMQSPLNIGIRHMLPTMPFIAILSTSAVKNFFTWHIRIAGITFREKLRAVFAVFTKLSVAFLLLIGLAVWSIGEAITAYPYYLSYYNQFAGGSANGYRYATDSNYDWGQDLKRLAEWTEKNNVKKIAVDYFGGGNAKYYLGNRAEFWWSARGNPARDGIEWLAVSVNSLEGAFGTLTPGYERKPEDEYRWLAEIQPLTDGLGAIPRPDDRAGTSLFIYHLK